MDRIRSGGPPTVVSAALARRHGNMAWSCSENHTNVLARSKNTLDQREAHCAARAGDKRYRDRSFDVAWEPGATRTAQAGLSSCGYPTDRNCRDRIVRSIAAGD